MKFTKEEACEKLVGLLTKNGEDLNISRRTLNTHVETLMRFLEKNGSDIELDGFVESVFEDVKNLDGNYRKDHSDFVKQWNESHKDNPNADRKDKRDDKKGDGDNDGLTEIQMVLKRVEALEKENSDLKKKENVASKRSAIENGLAEKGVDDKGWRKSILDEISINEDTDVDSKVASILAIYNKGLANNRGGNKTPKSTSDSGDDESKRFDYIKKRYKEESDRQKFFV